MEHGDAAVKNHFHCARIGATGHIGKCGLIQVKGGGDALGPQFQQRLDREIVGGIQGIISDYRDTRTTKKPMPARWRAKTPSGRRLSRYFNDARLPGLWMPVVAR